MISSPAPLGAELMTKISYNNIIWSALSYRINDAFSLYLGVDIDDRFYLAYAHDFITSKLSSVTNGTNEFKFGLDLIILNKSPSDDSKGLLRCLTNKLTKNKCYDEQIYLFESCSGVYNFLFLT